MTLQVLLSQLYPFFVDVESSMIKVDFSPDFRIGAYSKRHHPLKMQRMRKPQQALTGKQENPRYPELHEKKRIAFDCVRPVG